MSMEKEQRFLDIGGGLDWDRPNKPDFVIKYEIEANLCPELEEEMRQLRGVRLAKENSQNEYVILDPCLPKPIASKIEKELPNLHFVIGLVDWPDKSLPFKNGSFDVVEMNFVFSSLTIAQWANRSRDISDRVAPTYLLAISEAARVLKKDGRLILCEKQERMSRIIKLFYDDATTCNLPDYHFLRRLGLEPMNKGRQVEVTNPNRSYYTQIALQEMEVTKKMGKEEEATKLKPVVLEFRKTV